MLSANMRFFILKRVITLMATLAGASLVVFLVLEILPGNAAQMLMSARMPILKRYWSWQLASDWTSRPWLVTPTG